MRAVGWRGVVAGVVLGVTVGAVAGCDSTEDGEPSGVGPGGELTARAALGELRTVEPCGLIDLAGFAEYGTASLDHAGYTDFGVCDLEIEAGEETVGVSVGKLGRLDDWGAAAGNRIGELDGGVWVGEESEQSYCAQFLVFADEITLDVSVYDSVDEPAVDWCAVAGTAVDMVFDTISNGGVPHRQPAANSLQLVDACALTPPDITAEISELASAEMVESPEGVWCSWDDDPDGWGTNFVKLQLGFGPEPEVKGYGVTESEIAGRRSVTTKVLEAGGGDMAFCSVTTSHLPYGGVEDVPDAVELADVVVGLPDVEDDEAVCARAERIAERVWEKLPAR